MIKSIWEEALAERSIYHYAALKGIRAPMWLLDSIACETVPVAPLFLVALVSSGYWAAHSPGSLAALVFLSLLALTLALGSRRITRTGLMWMVIGTNAADFLLTWTGLIGGTVVEANPFFGLMALAWFYKLVAVPALAFWANRKGLGVVLVVASMAFVGVVGWEFGGFGMHIPAALGVPSGTVRA